MISSRDEIKRCIAAKRENWGGYFGKHTMMGEVENGLRGLKEILYGVSVVGVVVNCISVIYGGAT